MNHSLDFILLIPCFNNTDGLLASLKSIVYPTDKYKIIIIDDGSTPAISSDDIKKLIPEINLHIIRNNINKGITASLNAGLEYLKTQSNYKYFARLDANDICNPSRFSEQVNYLNSHSDIFLLGTWCEFINSSNHQKFVYKTAIEHSAIVKEMHQKCSFIHPTVMLRKDVLDTVGLYPITYRFAEDYAFFWEILKKHKGAILPKILVSIYVNSDNVSSKNYKKQLIERKAIIRKYGDNVFLKLKGMLLISIKQIIPSAFLKKIKFG